MLAPHVRMVTIRCHLRRNLPPEKKKRPRLFGLERRGEITAVRWVLRTEKCRIRYRFLPERLQIDDLQSYAWVRTRKLLHTYLSAPGPGLTTQRVVQ